MTKEANPEELKELLSEKYTLCGLIEGTFVYQAGYQVVDDE